MATPGRRPKPTHLKILEGNPGKRRLNKNEPTPDVEAPDPPESLSADARAEWDRIVPKLVKLGLVTALDRAALATYCEAWSTHEQASRLLAQSPVMIQRGWSLNRDPETGDIVGRHPILVKHPALQVRRDAASVIERMCTHFGLSPSSRARMELPEANPEDELERLLS